MALVRSLSLPSIVPSIVSAHVRRRHLGLDCLFNEQLAVLGSESTLIRSAHCWPARGPSCGHLEGAGQGVLKCRGLQRAETGERTSQKLFDFLSLFFFFKI